MDRRHHHRHHHPAPPVHRHHHHPAPPPPVVHHHHPPHHHHHLPPAVVITPPPPPPVVVVDHHHHSDEIFRKPPVKVYCKAAPHYSLSIRNGQVVLVLSNPSDPLQHWLRDDRHSTRIRDAEGLPGFALINKATGQALKHSFGASHPVQLVQYNPNVFDESILWSDKYLEDGFRVIRMVNNIRLNMDASHGGFFHAGVSDGSVVVLQDWTRGDTQRWNIIPH